MLDIIRPPEFRVPKYVNTLRSNNVHKALPDVILSPKKRVTNYSPVRQSSNMTSIFQLIVYVLKYTIV